MPYKQGTRTGCDYCPYHAVCGFDKKTSGFGYRKLRAIKPEEIWKEILPEEELPEDELEDDDTQKAEETGMRQGKSEDKNKGQNKQALHVEVSREVQDGSKVD